MFCIRIYHMFRIRILVYVVHAYTVCLDYVYTADLKGFKVRHIKIHSRSETSNLTPDNTKNIDILTKQHPVENDQRARKVHFPHVHQWTEHVLYSLYHRGDAFIALGRGIHCRIYTTYTRK